MRADEHFTDVFFTDRPKENKSVCLGYMRDRLTGDNFYHADRSHLVNLNHADSYYFAGRNIKIRCLTSDGWHEANVPKGDKVREFREIARNRGIRKLSKAEIENMRKK